MITCEALSNTALPRLWVNTLNEQEHICTLNPTMQLTLIMYGTNTMQNLLTEQLMQYIE